MGIQTPEAPGDHPQSTPGSPSVESDEMTTNSHVSAILNEDQDLSDGQTDITEDPNSDTNEPNGNHEAQGANGVSSQNTKTKTGKRKLTSPTGRTPPSKKDSQSKTVKLLNSLIERVNDICKALGTVPDSSEQLFQLREEVHSNFSSLNRRQEEQFRRHERLSNDIQSMSSRIDTITNEFVDVKFETKAIKSSLNENGARLEASMSNQSNKLESAAGALLSQGAKIGEIDSAVKNQIEKFNSTAEEISNMQEQLEYLRETVDGNTESIHQNLFVNSRPQAQGPIITPDGTLSQTPQIVIHQSQEPAIPSVDENRIIRRTLADIVSNRNGTKVLKKPEGSRATNREDLSWAEQVEEEERSRISSARPNVYAGPLHATDTGLNLRNNQGNVPQNDIMGHHTQLPPQQGAQSGNRDPPGPPPTISNKTRRSWQCQL